MKAIDVLDALKNYASEYKKEGVKSVIRNNHMNNLPDNLEISGDELEAIIVDFINFIGSKNCIDYALYTKDI